MSLKINYRDLQRIQNRDRKLRRRRKPTKKELQMELKRLKNGKEKNDRSSTEKLETIPASSD